MTPLTRKHLPLLFIGLLVISLNVFGMVACRYFAGHPEFAGYAYWSLGLALVLASMVCFFGCMWYMQTLGGEWSLNKGGMRLTIVITVMTVFLMLVTTSAFFKDDSGTPGLTQTLLSHFTSVVMTVIAFYFGSSAYVQVSESKTQNKKAEDKE